MFTSNKMAVLGGDSFRDEYSLAFDGSNDYINFGNVLNLGTGDFSISIWVKTSDFNAQYFISKYKDANNRWYLRGSGDAPRFQFYSLVGGSAGIAYYGGSAINLDDLQNQWVHFVLSADRDGNIVGYINGVLDDTDSADATDIDNTGNLEIGRYTSAYAECNISEVAFYNKALSANEAKTIYNGREPFNHKDSAFSGNLTAWWRMGDGVLDKYAAIGDETDTSLGADVITNGSFASDSGWNKNSMWAITGGVAVSDGSGANNINQSGSLTLDKVYKISFDIVSLTGGTGYAIRTGNSGAYSETFSTVGTHTVYQMCLGTSNNIYINAVGSAVGTIDNVIAREFGGNASGMINMTTSDFEGDTP